MTTAMNDAHSATGRIGLRCVVAWLALALSAEICSASPRVDLTLAVAGDAPLGVQQRWYQTLTESKSVSVRLRKSTSSDAPSQQAAGAGDNRVIRVVGVVDARGTLTVPGGRFGPNDRDRARQWLADLQADPAPPPGESPADRAKQETLGQLSKPVEFSTHGRDRWEVVHQLRRETSLPIEFDPAAQSRIPSGDDRPPEPLEDELKGVALGTALAALLRPAGLGLRARANGDSPALAVTAFNSQREVWPVGQLVPEGAKKALPELFEFFSAELDDVPLVRVIDSVGSRLHAPVLWDWRAMELAGVDPRQVRVSFPPRRTAYMMLLREVLRRAELRYELRLDDADKPFVWITTKKPLEMLEAANPPMP